MQNRNVLVGFILALSATSASVAQSLPAKNTPSATTAATVIPALIRYSGAAQSTGKSNALVTFYIFKEEQGGEPLWTETQNVSFDATGHYEIYLGSTNASGLPLDLFGNGEARWLEVQVAGEKQLPRVLLASVPYAMKAVDAATLGGLPASAFALAGSNTAAVQSQASASPDASSTVTTPGGTSGYLPVFSGAAAIDDSILFESGTKIGIDTKTPATTLDVNGAITARGTLTIENTGTATSTAGKNSQPIDFLASAYNSSTKKAVTPVFALQSEAATNDTTAPGATLNLLYGNGATPAETGLSISSKGIIKFAPGQTIPSSSSTGVGLNGTSTSGTGVEGTSSTGNGVLGDTAGTKVGTSGVMGVAGKANTSGFSGIAGVWGNASAHVGVLGTSDQYAGVQGISNEGPGVQGAGTNGPGVLGTSTNNFAGEFNSSLPGATTYATNTASQAGTSFYGVATGITSSALFGIATGQQGYGAQAVSEEGVGILGYSVNESNTGSTLQSYGNISGVWADTSGISNGNVQTLAALVATADNNNAAFLNNNSNDYITLSLVNYGDGGTGDARGVSTISSVMQATGSQGTCGIGSHGDLSCTGQVKTLSTTGNARMVETYAMQSPENWMEDFGSGRLSNGSATVAIDPAFAETANTAADYHIFLTPRGDSKGLYVANVTATEFQVRESGSGITSLGFDYRIVAKRRGYEAQRLTDVTDRFKAETAKANHFQQLQKEAKLSGRSQARPHVLSPVASVNQRH